MLDEEEGRNRKKVFCCSNLLAFTVWSVFAHGESETKKFCSFVLVKANESADRVCVLAQPFLYASNFKRSLALAVSNKLVCLLLAYTPRRAYVTRESFSMS